MGYFENTSAEAESAFYAAFENLDLDLMKSTWHQSDDVYCIHPGGPAQTGYEEVLRHWEFILSGTSPTKIDYKIISAVESGEYAIHLVQESIGSNAEQATVIATNTYIKTSNGWRLFSHHASLPPSQKSDVRNDVSVH